MHHVDYLSHSCRQTAFTAPSSAPHPRHALPHVGLVSLGPNVRGCNLVVIGYVGRIHRHSNPFGQERPPLCYLVILTIGLPALHLREHLTSVSYASSPQCLGKISAAPFQERIRSYSSPASSSACFYRLLAGGIASGILREAPVRAGRGANIHGCGRVVPGLQLGELIRCGRTPSFFSSALSTPKKEQNSEFATPPEDQRGSMGFMGSLPLATLASFAWAVFRCAELSGGFR